LSTNEVVFLLKYKNPLWILTEHIDTVIGAAGPEPRDHNAQTPYRTTPVREVSEV